MPLTMARVFEPLLTRLALEHLLPTNMKLESESKQKEQFKISTQRSNNTPKQPEPRLQRFGEGVGPLLRQTNAADLKVLVIEKIKRYLSSKQLSSTATVCTTHPPTTTKASSCLLYVEEQCIIHWALFSSNLRSWCSKIQHPWVPIQACRAR